MTKQFLEAGQIVNTHGIVGELKILPWCDSPEFLCSFDTFYIDKKPVKVCSARPHKGNALVMLEGVTDVNAAMRLKGKIVEIDRSKAVLPAGRHFIADLIGLTVQDADTGAVLGSVSDVLTPPSHEIYVVTGGTHSYMIPAVDAFVVEKNLAVGFLRVRLIEGMESDV